MTITITKKHLLIAAGVVLLVAIVFALTRMNRYDYEANAKSAKLDMKIVATLSKEILIDYQRNWQTAISDHQYINEKGKKEYYCYDFNKAIAARYLYFNTKGYFFLIDSISGSVKERMIELENNSSSHKDTQASLLQLYNTMNSLSSLTKDPKGSLLTFSQRINDLAIDFDNKYEETDLKIIVSEDEEKEAISNLMKLLLTKEIELIAAEEQKYEPNKKSGEAFLAENAKKEGVITLPSGLQYKVMKEGSGKKASEESRVRVRYEGKLIDGTIFDTNFDSDPSTFVINKVIPGFKEALLAMSEGSEWEIYVPQELGYGKEDMGNIQPYSTLIYHVKLIKVLD